MKSKFILIGLVSCFATFSQAAINFQSGSGTTNPLSTLDLSGFIYTFDTSLGILNSVTLMLAVDSTQNFTKFENIHAPSIWTVDLAIDTSSNFCVQFLNSALGIGVAKDMTMAQNSFSVPTYAGTDYVVPFLFNPVAASPGFNSADFGKAFYDLSAFKGNGVTKVGNMEVLYNPNWQRSGPTGGDVGTITGNATVGWAVAYNYTAVPEPSTWALLAGGLGMLTFGHRLRRRR